MEKEEDGAQREEREPLQGSSKEDLELDDVAKRSSDLSPSTFISPDFDFDEEETHSDQREFLDRIEPCGGCIGRLLGRFWRSLEGVLKLQKKFLKSFFKISAAICFLIYFVAALYTWMNSDEGFEVCRSYGFAVVIVCIGLLVSIQSFFSNRFSERQRRGSLYIYKLGSKLFSFTEYTAAIAGIVLFGCFIVIDTRDDRRRLLSFGGWMTFALIGLLFSAHPEHIRWKTVLRGLCLQMIIGIATVKWSLGRKVFECLGNKVKAFLEYGYSGAAFAYGDFLVHDQKIFAFQAMCVLYFMGMVMQIFFYYGWLQAACYKLGSLMQKVLGTTIIESVNAVMTVFLGMNEVPFVYHTYIKYLTRSEIHAIMTACFAAVSGSMMAAYTSVGADPSLIITASSMAAPAALGYAKLFYPETRKTKTSSKNIQLHKSEDNSVMDAACSGASMAIMIIQGILASLVAFISFIAFLDGVLGYLGSLVGAPQLTFEYALERVFVPIAWLMGVKPSQCDQVAKLIGMKTTVNEFIAYKELGVMKSAGTLSARSEAIATFALCGFANPGSVSIMLATLSGFCPEQRTNIISVSLRAFIAATFTSFMSACIVGLLLPESGFNTELGLNSTIPL